MSGTALQRCGGGQCSAFCNLDTLELLDPWRLVPVLRLNSLTLRPNAADRAAAEANTISTAWTMGFRCREDGPPFALVDSSAAKLRAF